MFTVTIKDKFYGFKSKVWDMYWLISIIKGDKDITKEVFEEIQKNKYVLFKENLSFDAKSGKMRYQHWKGHYMTNVINKFYPENISIWTSRKAGWDTYTIGVK